MIGSHLLKKWGAVGLVVCLLAPMGCQTPPPSEPYAQYLAEKDRHDRALNRIGQLGGSVTMSDPGATVSLRGTSAQQTREALDLLEDIMLLDSVRLTQVQVDRRALRGLEGLHLRHLTVSQTPLGSRELEALFTFDGLRSLHLIDTGTGDQVIPHLTRYRDLEKLTLVSEPLTSEGVAGLADLHRLRELRLVRIEGVSRDALESLVQVNTRLVIELEDHDLIRGSDAER